MENKFEEINEEGMVSLLKRELKEMKTNNDTLYVMPSEFYSGVENITELESEISTHILGLIGSSKNEEESIEFNVRPFELFDLLVNFHYPNTPLTHHQTPVNNISNS